MDTTVNFYIVTDEPADESKKLYKSIKSNDPLYLNFRLGDTVVLNENDIEYSIVKTTKNLYNGEIDVYITKLKTKAEVMNEIEDLANKTMKTVLDSIKDALDSNEDINK